MIDKLQAELLKVQDSLSNIEFKIGSENFTFNFRYLTLLEKVRIEQMCIKSTTIINTDGSTDKKFEKQEHLIPIHTILEKALNEDGKRIFSHTNPEHFKLISDFPAGIASVVAYEMTLDIMGTFKDDSNG